MNILLLEPFYTGSHKQWAEGLQKHSSHNIQILSLKGHYWKWRMHGGAIKLAEQFNQLKDLPDLILATDMLDLTTFLSLTRKKSASIPVALYFHENQLTYPWSPTDRDVQQNRDNHYSFINYSSAMAADKVFFNSQYHMNSFIGELPNFLKGFPDYNMLYSVEAIKTKSEVLHLGMDLSRFDPLKPDPMPWHKRAVLLWNHRWEYDKNPEQYFETLYELDRRGVEFYLVILGQNFSQSPQVFEQAKEHFGDRVLHYGYAKNFEDYAKWLWQSDILFVTSNQDFFGGSVVEAMYCNSIPLLPYHLAYLEHIPEAYHKTFFYRDDENPTNRLQRMIFDVSILRKQNTNQFIKHYDWSKQITVYDSAFQHMNVKS